ncbi:MAG: hypothetical protein J3R72DRAFT_518902 [Linnemannia gamsii]|nr:MAG: hypothetical protein J3R72DRAFT_518902 [Linnemannia gamsii]
MADRPLGSAAHDPSSSSESRENRETDFIVDMSLGHPVNVHDMRVPTVETQESESAISSDLEASLAKSSQFDLPLGQPLGAPQHRDIVVEGPLQPPISKGAHLSGKNDKSTTASGFLRRWYFKDKEMSYFKDKEMDTGSPSPTQHLELVDEEQEPVSINVITETLSQCIEWHLSARDIPQGSYDLVIGISSRNLDLNAVDSISFDIVDGTNQSSDRPNVMIPSATLKNLFATPSTGHSNDATASTIDDASTTAATNAQLTPIQGGYCLSGSNTSVINQLLRLRLHDKIVVMPSTNDSASSAEAMRVLMTIETWKGVSSNPGGIGLYFLELHSNSSKVYRNDPSYKKHHPFAWFIDVNAGAHRNDSKEIISYSFSGDGAYVAVLVHSSKGQDLEIYRINQDIINSPLVCSWVLSPSKDIKFDISVSWNASQIVVLDLTTQQLSTVYNRDPGYKHASKPTPSGSSEGEYSVGRLHSKLENYRVKGTFYASTNLADILKDEIFVAFDGATLTIYKIFGGWQLYKTMSVGGQRHNLTHLLDQYPNWKEHLRGGRLVLPNDVRGYISTWFLWKVRNNVAAMDIPTAASDNHYIATSLSAHGALFAMATKSTVDVYLAETWTRLGSWSLPSDGDKQTVIVSVDFMSGYGRLLVSTSSDSEPANHSYGYIVDIDTMTKVDRIDCRNLRHYSRTTLDTTNHSASMLLQQTKATLGAIRHTDRLVRSFSRVATKCTDRCTSNDAFQPPSSSELQAEVVMRAFGPPDRRETIPLIAVTTRNTKTGLSKKLTLSRPNDSRLVGMNRSSAHGHSYLVVVLTGLVLVWRSLALPDSVRDLLFAIGTTDDAEWTVCQHHQLHRRGKAGEISTRSLLDPRIHNPHAFLSGVARLVEIFKDADETSKRSIIRYVERHMNQCLDPDNDSAAILVHLCASWTVETHEHLLVFIKALLKSPSFRWIPAPAISPANNPISILVGHLESSLMAMDIVEIVIAYCIHQAKVDSDLRFLNPVFISLRAAFKQRDIDSGLLTRVMRSFAYFPARDYHFVMDHYTIARSFYKRHRWKMLHQQKNPILQTNSTGAVGVHVEKFTPHLYVASFDMLWSVEDIAVPSNWFLALCQRFLLFVSSTSRKQSILRSLELDDLDNPALIALIRFKWMKIGFTYWLLKTLLLTYMIGYFLGAVLTGLYDSAISAWVEWYNISVEAMLICIWLSVLGCTRDLIAFAFFRAKTRDAWYDLIDVLFVFTLSVAFLRDDDLTWRVLDGEDGYQYVISFTILLVLLRLLIRFRVMKTVGSYLSIIRRTIRSIWVFVLIFACTIVAFTIVLLYVQYVVCQDSSCMEKNAEGNMDRLKAEGFFVALSSTYYVTGGLFDAMQRVLKTGDWMYRLMLMVYIFTTTIMLNILIGLVNHAFDNDDRISKLEWMENRMYWVIHVENILRGLPFFKGKDWFPEKIYYTATPQQYRDYRLESLRLAKLSAAAALPLESNLHDDEFYEYATTTDTKQQIYLQQQQQQQQPLSMDRLRNDLKEQLEAQRRQSDEKIEQLQAQLSEILTVLKVVTAPRGG